MKIFRIIELDEPSHWAPYDDWLRARGCRPPNWYERAIDHFIHGELLFLKLPLLFLSPRLSRRTCWPDEQDVAFADLGAGPGAGLITKTKAAQRISIGRPGRPPCRKRYG